MVGNRLTIAADGSKQKKPKRYSDPNCITDLITQSKGLYNNNTTDNNNTPNLTAHSRPPHKKNIKLTMSTPDPPTGSGTSRRRVQRFK